MLKLLMRSLAEGISFFVHTVLPLFVENLPCSDGFLCHCHAVELQAFILWILQLFRED